MREHKKHVEVAHQEKEDAEADQKVQGEEDSEEKTMDTPIKDQTPKVPCIRHETGWLTTPSIKILKPNHLNPTSVLRKSGEHQSSMTPGLSTSYHTPKFLLPASLCLPMEQLM